MAFSAEQGLVRALAASVAFHALLLIGSVAMVKPRLVMPDKPGPVVRVAMVPLVTAERQAIETSRKENVTFRKTVVSTEKRPAALSSPSHSVSLARSAAVAQSDAGAKRDGAAARRQQAPEAEQSGVDADALRQYRMALAIAARAHKAYPAQARDNAQEGTVDVLVVVHRGMVVPEVSLSRSSGYRLLDEQAVLMMTRAAAVAGLSPALREAAFSLVMPIRFGLDEGT